VSATCDQRLCPCECHDGVGGAHHGVSCAAHQEWLDADVLVQLSSLQNVTYRHVVSSGLTRREWLDMDRDDIGEALIDAVVNHVEVIVLDDPRGDM
jgi:hypothetical protein